MRYTLKYDITYWSHRYNKLLMVPKGFISDGASGAIDIQSEAWWVHDKICADPYFEDGSPITNWQASQILSDILRKEGRWIRARYWFTFTWLFGCKKARKNGMF